MIKKSLFIAAIISLCGVTGSRLGAQQPDAIFKLLRHQWTLNADGSSDYRYRHEVQIVTNSALTAYADKGETFVVYNPDYEQLTINEVYTLRADGSRVDMPQNAFIYQLPAECADCGRFNHMRELAMVHTGMELGCTVVVDYTLHRRYNLLDEQVPLLRECPVERLEIVVDAPADMAISHSLSGENYLPMGVTPRDLDGRTITLTALPQAPADSYLPADVVPTLHLYNGTATMTPAFDQQKLEAAYSTSRRLLKGDNGFKSVTALRDWVVDNIHLNDIHPSHLAYTHATADEVWQSGCGTATDKAVLLAAMLRNASYDARVIGVLGEEVGVTLDSLEYRLSVRQKSAPELIGEAQEAVVKIKEERTIENPTFDTLADGFFSCPLGLYAKQVEGLPQASRLAPSRTSPVQSIACDIDVTTLIPLPKGLKMVGDKVERHLAFDGIGEASLSIKQSGSKLKVTQRLHLDKSLIMAGDYQTFRQLVGLYQGIDRVVLRAK